MNIYMEYKKKRGALLSPQNYYSKCPKFANISIVKGKISSAGNISFTKGILYKKTVFSIKASLKTSSKIEINKNTTIDAIIAFKLLNIVSFNSIFLLFLISSLKMLKKLEKIKIMPNRNIATTIHI